QQPQKSREGSVPLEFRAEHVSTSLDLLGQICVLFSCYAAGTPRRNSYLFKPIEPKAQGVDPETLTSNPFTAALPQALMTRGALGVIGHVDRSWSTSFSWHERYQGELGRFQHYHVANLSSLKDSLWQMLAGERVGHAMRSLNKRFAFLAGRLTNQLDNLMHLGRIPDHSLIPISSLWTAANDARNLVLLGDPAAYVRGRRESHTSALRLNSRILALAEAAAARDQTSTEQWIEKLIEQRSGGRMRFRG
ncbi:MAG: hypothetical protein AAF725_24080, partial [Acidobacteriota bacterium]